MSREPHTIQSPRSEWIWFNGEMVPWDQAQIHVLSHVVHYGSGVFEGIRVYDTPGGPAVVGLDAHVKRLFESAKLLYMEIPFSAEVVREAILETVRRNGHGGCYVRPLAYRGFGQMGVNPTGSPVELAIASWEWGTYLGDEAMEQGVDVGVSSWRKMAPGTHPAISKAVGNYVNSQLIVLEARRHGYHEGIVLDVDGFACEGSGENIFIVRDGRILTPPLGASILGGITRGYVLALAKDRGIEVVEQRLSREMLMTADEMFMSGTAAEVTPVRSIDRQPIGAGRRGPITEQLQADFFALVRGEVEDRHGWLTPV